MDSRDLLSATPMTDTFLDTCFKKILRTALERVSSSRTTSARPSQSHPVAMSGDTRRKGIHRQGGAYLCEGGFQTANSSFRSVCTQDKDQSRERPKSGLLHCRIGPHLETVGQPEMINTGLVATCSWTALCSLRLGKRPAFDCDAVRMRCVEWPAAPTLHVPRIKLTLRVSHSVLLPKRPHNRFLDPSRRMPILLQHR